MALGGDCRNVDLSPGLPPLDTQPHGPHLGQGNPPSEELDGMANWLETEDGEWINADRMTTAKYVASLLIPGRWRLVFYESGNIAGTVVGTKPELEAALHARSRFRASPEVVQAICGTKTELRAALGLTRDD
jgi:hypothetical protein